MLLALKMHVKIYILLILLQNLKYTAQCLGNSISAACSSQHSIEGSGNFVIDADFKDHRTLPMKIWKIWILLPLTDVNAPRLQGGTGA